MTHGTEQCRFETFDFEVLKKLFKHRPLCELPSGNELDFDRFLDHFFDTFLTKISTFLMLWLLGNLTQVATSRPCRARCI